MPDVVIERAEIEERNRAAKELARPGLIAAAALAAQSVAVVVDLVEPTDDVPPPPPGWVLADE
jgi:hypothetical protein